MVIPISNCCAEYLETGSMGESREKFLFTCTKPGHSRLKHPVLW